MSILSLKFMRKLKTDTQSEGVKRMDCAECKSPLPYRHGLCEECYGKLFEIAKESDEVGNNEKL